MTAWTRFLNKVESWRRLELDVMDDEYRKEQERVRGLPKEQLAKYPYEVLVVGKWMGCDV